MANHIKLGKINHINVFYSNQKESDSFTLVGPPRLNDRPNGFRLPSHESEYNVYYVVYNDITMKDIRKLKHNKKLSFRSFSRIYGGSKNLKDYKNILSVLF